MKTVNTTEFRKNMPNIINTMKKGEKIDIVKNYKVIATIIKKGE